MDGTMGDSGKSSRAAVSPSGSTELEGLRRRIDEIDAEILEQLNERARTVQAVGRLKESRGAPVYSAERERQIVEQMQAENSGPFPNDALGPVFREIISATRSLEAVLAVAYLGPEGTFCHLAASEQFGRLADLQGQASIADVFAAVERGSCQLGVVPVENTTDGIVTQAYDRLPEFEGTLCGELLVRVSLCLLSRGGSLSDVSRVVSHPQALAQCRGWLDRHLPGVERVESPSTAAAARLAAEQDDVGAIGSAIAEQAYGLRTIESSIEDRRDNTTRFLLIGRTAPEPTGNDLTSLVFTLRKDESGALHRLLEPFARFGVNLTSIHLRPFKGKPWEYLFFLDAEGHQRDTSVAQALEAAAGVAYSHRVLGSFPRATQRIG
jgi:chorismate mutase/prephenate dehydratase